MARVGAKAGARALLLTRIVLAVLGGYLLANFAGMVLVVLVPGPAAGEVEAALLLSFPVYAGAVIWTFSARSVRTACVGILLPCLVCLALVAVAAGLPL